jgi:hypothetical protein
MFKGRSKENLIKPNIFINIGENVQRQKLLYHVRKKWPHRTGKVKRNHPRTVKPSREKLKTNGGPLAFDYKGFTTFRYFGGMFEGKNAPAGPRKAKKAKGFISNLTRHFKS